MRFDSHVIDLLHVGAALVNVQTCTNAGGRPAPTPDRQALKVELSRVLVRDGRRPRVTDLDADVLARFALDARIIFEAAADDDADRTAQAVNELLVWSAPRPRLDLGADDGWNLHFHGPTDRLGDGWAAGCAAALALVIGSTDRGRLGVCEAPACDRVYVDRSKNSSRRFCGLQCQNRVKNSSHRKTRPKRPDV